MSPRKAATAILIHGAWQGSWVWARLLPFLESAGINAIAIDLPGNGSDETPLHAVSLDLYLAHIARVAAAISGPLALVGHSGGGLVATAAAKALSGKVDRVAYVAGMMLPSGMSFSDLMKAENASERGLAGIGPHLVWSDDRLSTTVPPEAAADIFLGGLPRDEAISAAARLTPQSQGGRDIAAAWTASGFGKLPRLYVECLADRSVSIELQRRMQELVPGAARVSLDTDHAPQVSAPEKLAEALVPFLKG